jgi:hypothetical protein
VTFYLKGSGLDPFTSAAGNALLDVTASTLSGINGVTRSGLSLGTITVCPPPSARVGGPSMVLVTASTCVTCVTSVGTHPLRRNGRAPAYWSMDG